MTPEQITTGAELRQWRRAQGLTQQQLADALRVRRGSVGRWERGERRVPPWLTVALSGLQTRPATET